LLLILEEFRNREEAAPTSFGVPCDDLEGVDALAIRIGERVQQDVVDDAENRGGGTDSQAESQNCDRREAGVVA
jgi:hypothetical protein